MLRPIILIASAAALLVQTAAAQGQPYLQPTTPMQYGTYTLTRGFEPAPPIAQRGGPAVLFDNNDGDEIWFSTGVQVSPGVTQTWTIDDEIIDQLALPQAGVNRTEQVNGITINYCSSIPDPNGTLDVLPLNLYFYKDYVDPNSFSNSPTGWPIADCEYGLFFPGGTATGGTLCLSVTVDLGYGVECTVTQELTAGGAEPIGVGWTFGDPRPSPLGGSGPVIDNVITNAPGYGALDEAQLHDRTAQVQTISMVGNGADFYLSHVITLYGQPSDIEAYYHLDPISQLFAPEDGDSLILQADTAIHPGSNVTFSIVNPSVGSDLRLMASFSPRDNTHQLTAANPVVAATLLVNPNQKLATVAMPGGTTGPVSVPPTLSLGTMYLQAFEYSGAFGPSTVTAVSNGLKATIQ